MTISCHTNHTVTNEHDKKTQTDTHISLKTNHNNVTVHNTNESQHPQQQHNTHHLESQKTHKIQTA